MSTLKVSTADELLDALQHTKTIEVDGTLQGMPMISAEEPVHRTGSQLPFLSGGGRIRTSDLRGYETYFGCLQRFGRLPESH
jgi:hypothetical protein